MKAHSKTWSPEGETTTPYKRARKEWDDRMGSAIAQARNWRLATFATICFIALPSLGGMIYLGAQPKAVPHIVEVSSDGSASYRGPAGRAWEQYTPSAASMRYHLSRFVTNTRMISSDQAVVKRNWLDAYTLVTSDARNTLNEYARTHDPFGRSQQERVSVQILSMVPMSGDSWQIDWREDSWGLRGERKGESYWRGIFRVVTRKPENEDMLASNPIGLYIDEFHWSKIQR